jgi:hypothetical protein
MSWTCPACHNAIQYSEVETAPRPDLIYRCSVCRLELVVDPSHERMILAPFPQGGEEDAGELARRRT